VESGTSRKAKKGSVGMKNPKKLTRDQKILLSKRGIDPKGLYLQRELPNTLILVKAATGETMVVEK
jgi:hypothetical protein